MEGWSPYTKVYKPLAAGSIDGTDTEPHDRGVVRAMNANYTPSEVESIPENTIFVGRLPHSIGEDELWEKFCRFGKLKSVRVIRDIVTGQSKGYGFVEFSRKSDAVEAFRVSQHLEIEGFQLIVDKEAGHTLKGWIPRRLGGGWGGRKEAGQLRFGCVERPWRKPIVLPQQTSGSSVADDGSVKISNRERTRDRFRSSGNSREYHPHKMDSDRWGSDRYHDYERHNDRRNRSDNRRDRQETFAYNRRGDRDREHTERGSKARGQKRHYGRDHEYGDSDWKNRDYDRNGKDYHTSRQDRRDNRWKERGYDD